MDLRDTVYELKRRRHEAKTQNELLKQLSGLWERLCSEVESEIQDGVRQQLNFNIPSFEEAMTDNRRISPAENQEINSKLNSIRNSRLSIPILNQPHHPLLDDQQLDHIVRILALQERIVEVDLWKAAPFPVRILN